jgi:branched-chain amino acid transport system permease protein
VNIVYFQQGIMGWLQSRYPEMFGIVVDKVHVQTKKQDKAEA